MAMGNNQSKVSRQNSSWTEPIMSSIPLGNLEPLDAFNIELIREKILKYAIYPDEGKFHRSAACTLRLVNKAWNESVPKILRKREQPLYKLNLYDRKKLEGFLKTFRNSSNIPPFTLKISFYLRDNVPIGGPDDRFPILIKILTNCASGLLQLTATIDVFKSHNIVQRRSSSPPKWLWALGKLKKLDIEVYLLYGPVYPGPPMLSEPTHVEILDENDLALGINFIKILMNATTSCFKDSRFQLNYLLSPYPYQNVRPSTDATFFSAVILPSQITNIRFGGDLGGKDFEMLANNPLPNLTCLTFDMVFVPFPDDFVFRCLDKCRTTLKMLSFEDLKFRGQGHGTHHPTLIRFPIMENLKQLSIKTINVELEAGLDSLEKYFPNMHTLRLRHQTEDMFRKWTTGSRFASVTTFELLMSIGKDNGHYHAVLQSVKMETIQQVNLTFPKLRKLTMSIDTDDTGALSYLIKEMEQLTYLTLIVILGAWKPNSDIMDSLLTGISVKAITKSKTNPNFWLENQVIVDGTPSIGNLKNLTNLDMEDGRFHFPRRKLPYISDFSLEFALCHVPNLKSVRLTGDLKDSVSNDMVDKWQRQGRSLFVNTCSFHCRDAWP